MPEYIGVVSAVIMDKIKVMASSRGDVIKDMVYGLTPLQCLEFYYQLKKKNKKGSQIAVTYASAREMEFMFQHLPAHIKDRIFKSYRWRQIVEELSDESDRLSQELELGLEKWKELESRALIDINNILIDEVSQIDLGDFKISCVLGKRLLVRKSKSGHVVTIYDIYNFFKGNLREAYHTWTGIDVPALDRHNIMQLDLRNSADTTQLEATMIAEAQMIAELAQMLGDKLSEGGIKLAGYHGPTAITSAVLGKSKAKDEYHAYARRTQHPPALWGAMNGSFFGGRTEQIKLGVCENVRVYDLNSAYASASLLLPRLTKRPSFTDKFEVNPFSIWYVEFDAEGCYLPCLPVRTLGNRIIYPSRGSGWYWFPEVNYAMKKMKSVTIKHGFVFDYIPAKFTEAIADLYEFRRRLKAEGHPLESAVKTALAGIYGKFCEREGRGRFYNLFYAAFITSFTRAKIAESIEGREESVICILTDAIHTMSDLDVDVNDDMGGYSLKTYDRGYYCDLGVYGLEREGDLVKTATMGFAKKDFGDLMAQFMEKGYYAADLELFIGHNLHSMAPGKFKKYLQIQRETKDNSPLAHNSRAFIKPEGFDLSTGWIDSLPKAGMITDSRMYSPSAIKDIHMAKEVARAKR